MLEDLTLNQIRMYEQELQTFRMFGHDITQVRQQQEFLRTCGFDMRTFHEKHDEFSPLLEAQRMQQQQEDFLRIHGIDIRAMEEHRRRLVPLLQEHQRQTAWLRFVGLDSRTIEEALRAHEDYTRCTKWFMLEVLGKRGWIGLERVLSNEVFARLFRLIGDKGRRAADVFICNEFRKRSFERLRFLVNDWWKVPYLNKRKSAVRAAIRAHRKAEYALSIPTLFPFVDGLTCEIAARFPAKYGSAKSIKNLANAYMERGLPPWCVNFEETVKFRFYKNFNPLGADRPPCAYNRHGVMHGSIVNYASEPNSLRVILLINVLVTIFSAESKATRQCRPNRQLPE